MIYSNQNRQVKFNADKVQFDKIAVKSNSTMDESFGAWLKSKREQAGFNQTELAQRSHTTKSTISLLEADKIAQPRFDKLDKIAKALGISKEVMRSEYAKRMLISNDVSETHEIANGVRLQLDHSARLTEAEKKRILDVVRLLASEAAADKDKNE